MDPRRRALLAALAAGAVRPAFADAKIMTKRIPGSGEELAVIGAGTWQSFDAGQDAAARGALREVLQAFVQAGGQVLDSSPMYGSSETVLGDLVAELGLRERLFMATKVWTSGRDEGQRQIETSFRRMRVERMDLLQIHNLVDVQTHTRTLREMRSSGKVRYIGITHYTSSAYAELERWLKAEPYDFLQINYSLAEREAERRLFPLCRERKVAVIVNRPFAEGALFRKVKGKPLPPWAAELGVHSWAQYFLKWIVSHPAVTCAIPGTSRPDHMKDNLAAGQGPMPDAAARRRMAQYFEAL
jgi:aryl-alcohol dehydrogenase-like predicted oxidoreductase